MSKGNAKGKGGNPKKGGGNAVSIANTPQAKDDHFVLDLSQSSLTFDLLGNDSGGKAKSLWSIDEGPSYQNLMDGDADGIVEATTHGASISINADDSVNYDTSTLDASFQDSLTALTAGQSLEDTFVYAIRMGNGTLSWATATVELEGRNDDPTLAAAAVAAQEDGSFITVDLSTLGDDVDSDDDGSTLSYVITGAPTEGAATISGTSLSFDPGSDFQDLAEGETRDVVIQVTATDTHGASATNDVTVTVTGTNDAPTLSATTASADEDGTAISVDLAALADDLDSDDDANSLSYAITGAPSEGSAAISGTSLSFDPGADFQDLAEGETREVVINVTATDAHGATASNDVTVTVTGTNDAPTLSVTTASADEDGTAISVDLAALADDLDSDDDANSLSYAITGAPSEGSAAISGTSLSFDPGADFQDLAEGETRDVVIQVTATDTHGATASNDVTVTVTGTNDAPTLSATTAGAEEDGTAINVDLAALADDLDSDDDANSLSYAITGAPTEGAASISGTNLSFDSGSAFQDLAEGETRDVVIQVTATDMHGASATNDVTVTVTGTNDAPTLSATTASADEDGTAISVDLAALADDLDSDDDANSLSYAITGAPTEGATTISGTSLSFDPGSAFQDLAEGATRDVVIQVTATDSHGATASNDVTVTVTGTNDAPTLSVTTASADEDGTAISVDLAALADDLDSDDDANSLSYAITGAPSEGSAAISGTSLSFNPGSAFQDLAEGETRDVVIQVTATDTHGASATNDVTVTVTGTNDAPTLSATTASVEEDGAAISVDLASLADDLDSDDDANSLSYAITGAPSEGSAAISGTSLSFDPGADFQDLAEGETREVVINVTATDAHGATASNDVTVTVTGTNDAPTLSVTTASADEDGTAISVDLAALADDLDSDDDANSLSYAITGAPSEGSAAISGTSLSFNPGSAFQDLAEGETRDVVIQVTATDTHGASATNDVTVTVTGTNDAPTLSATTASADEDGTAISVDLAALADDLDSDDDANSLSYAITGAPTEGATTISGTSLSFDPGSAFQDLAEGATRDVVIQVTATDSHGATASNDVTVTVTGSNDAPTLSVTTASAEEDGAAISVDLASLADDLDSDDDANSLSYAITGVPTEGAATISGTSLSFDPGSDFQDLAEGETRDVVIQVTATDTHGASATNDVTVTVTGTNDAPTLSATTASADEDGTAISVDLAALADDLDSDDDANSLSYAITGAPTEGATTISGTSLSFDPGSAFQDLAEGATRDVVIQVTATDTHGATATNDVTVTVTGTNDAPTLSATTASAEEDGTAISVDLAALADDLDSDDDANSLNYAITGAPSEGSAAISGTSLSFDPGSAFQDLAEGETRDVVIQVTATDSHGATASNDVTVTVTGSNDAPTLSATTASAEEDGVAISVDLAALADDLDSDDNANSLSYVITGAPTEGAASISGASLSFDPGSAFQDLAEGETRDVVIQVTASDSHGATATNDVTVTVTGTNDAPTLSATTASAEEDGAAISVDLASLADDLDSDDDANSLSYAITGAPTEGAASISGTSLSFDPGADFQDLAEGETRDVVIQVTATDTHGATASNDVTVTVTGTNDAPTLSATTAGAEEDGTAINVDLAALADDLDSDDDANSLSYAITGAPSEGSAAISGTSLSFDPGSDFQDLAEGETREVVINVTATDAHGASASGDVTVTVAGTNDAPIITGGDVSAELLTEPSSSGVVLLEASGVLNFEDIDLTDIHSVSALSGTTADDNISSGSLAVQIASATDSNGENGQINWTYTVDNSDVSWIAAGDDPENNKQTFVVRLEDQSGGFHEQTVEFFVGGGVAAPVVSPLATSVSEADVDGQINSVLFIDDSGNRSQGWKNAWFGALGQNGYSYDQETMLSLNGNPSSNLNDYDLVIWSVSDRAYTNLTSTNINTMINYLDQGGRLLYAGGHNVYSEPHLNQGGFASQYLGITDYQSNMPTISNTNQGWHIASGPDGNYTLSSEPGAYYGGTMTSAFGTTGSSISLMQLDNWTHRNNDIVVLNDTGLFVTSTWGFDMAQLDAAYRTDFLGYALDEMGGKAFEFDLLSGASDPNGGTLSVSNLTQLNGPAVSATVDAEGVLTFTPGSLDFLDEGETVDLTYEYDVSNADASTSNTVTITVVGVADDISL